MKRKNLPFVQKQKRKSLEFYKQLIKKGVYQTIKILLNITSVLYKQKGWKQENSYRLL